MGGLIFGETVTVQRPTTTTNRYGDTVRSTTVTTHDVTHVAVAPAGQDEDPINRTTGEVADFDLYCSPDADITATDRVVVRGGTFEVIGPPAVWVSPYTGREPGLVVRVKRVIG